MTTYRTFEDWLGFGQCEEKHVCTFMVQFYHKTRALIFSAPKIYQPTHTHTHEWKKHGTVNCSFMFVVLSVCFRCVCFAVCECVNFFLVFQYCFSVVFPEKAAHHSNILEAQCGQLLSRHCHSLNIKQNNRTNATLLSACFSTHTYPHPFQWCRWFIIAFRIFMLGKMHNTTKKKPILKPKTMNNTQFGWHIWWSQHEWRKKIQRFDGKSVACWLLYQLQQHMSCIQRSSVSTFGIFNLCVLAIKRRKLFTLHVCTGIPLMNMHYFYTMIHVWRVLHLRLCEQHIFRLWHRICHSSRDSSCGTIETIKMELISNENVYISVLFSFYWIHNFKEDFLRINVKGS